MLFIKYSTTFLILFRGTLLFILLPDLTKSPPTTAPKPVFRKYLLPPARDDGTEITNSPWFGVIVKSPFVDFIKIPATRTVTTSSTLFKVTALSSAAAFKLKSAGINTP